MYLLGGYSETLPAIGSDKGIPNQTGDILLTKIPHGDK